MMLCVGLYFCSCLSDTINFNIVNIFLFPCFFSSSFFYRKAILQTRGVELERHGYLLCMVSLMKKNAVEVHHGKSIIQCF